jgi:magnesium-transporting ATPase (P-type)
MSTAWILVYLLPFILAIAAVSIFIATIFVYVVTVISRTSSPAGQVTTVQPAPIFASFAFLYGLLIIVYVASLVLNLVLIYKLVNRRNTHFKRQIFLFEDLVAAVKATATKKGVDVEIGLASCDRTVREVKADETEKNAMLWAILSAFIFLAIWYVWYFLMKDFYKHERREDGFWEDIGRAMDKCGIKFSSPKRTEPLAERSFALYLVVSIITLGLFGIYWMYVLIRDPNQHFKYHIQIEDQLLSTLETVTA